MSEFSFPRDFKSIDWASTLKLSCVRAGALGVVCMPLALYSAIAGRDGMMVIVALLLPLLVPLYYIVLAPFYVLALKLLATIFPEGLGALVVALMRISLGLAFVLSDPLVYWLQGRRPNWVPTPDFKAFNFAFMIFVLRQN